MADALRVAIFGESYLPYLSGVTIATEALARGLAEAGHGVLLVVPAAVAGTPAPPTAAGVRTVWLPSYQAPPPAPPRYRMPWPVPSGALRAVRDFRPDIVHANSPFVSGIMARRAARVTGAALVFTHHTRFGDYGHYLGPLAAPGSALVARYVSAYWRGCSAVIAPSRDLAAEIAGELGDLWRPIVQAIPTGVDVAAIRALPEGHPRRESGWVPGVDLVIAALGRLAPEKSVDILMRAFELATRSLPEARLLLIGGGPSEPSLRRAVSRSPLAGSIGFTGQREHQAALGLVKACDLFAFASRTETQGLVLAEALACGVPIAALAGPGVADTVRDGIDGIVVPRLPDQDPAVALAAAIVRLGRDGRLRRRMAQAASAGADRFDLAGRIEEVVALYTEILASRKRPA